MASPEKIAEKDLQQAFSVVESTEDEDFNLDDLAGEVLGELARRIKDPVLRKELPGTGLIQLAKALVRAQQDSPQTTEANKNPTVLEMVKDSTLPDERKKELLLQERERLEDELEMVRLELEEL